MNTLSDTRPDGFVHVWDFPDDPDEPCWNQAAIEAVQYVAGLLGLDPETDFKIECQTVDYREEMASGTFVGINDILIHGDNYLHCNNVNLTIRDIGFIIDGFISGWFSAHSTPTKKYAASANYAASVNWEGIAKFLGVDESEVRNVPLAPLRTDSHTEHCCLQHGCKYRDDFCTVTTKVLPQSYPCEWCDDVPNH